jgi:predicted transcriptional regulator
MNIREFLKSRRSKAWKLDFRAKNPKEAKDYAREANYVAKGIGLGKPKHKYQYKAIGNIVYVRYAGKVRQ